ncbi:LOW QUALITY PROTEIN: spermatogenesis-associated protein 32 [Hipposideros larvatus]
MSWGRLANPRDALPLKPSHPPHGALSPSVSFCLSAILNQHQQAQEEDEMELENELLKLEPPHNMDLNLGSKLEMEIEAEAVPQLEPCLAPVLMPEVDLDADLEACNEVLEQHRYRIESLHPDTEEEQGLAQCNASLRSARSNSSYPSSLEEEQVSTTHRSIHLQTSKHLFWADKLIQTSDQSLQQETSMQPGKESTDKTNSHLNQEPVLKITVCSKKQLQNPNTQPAGSQQPPSAHLSSSSLPQGISLADVIRLATSVAMAASNTTILSNWEYTMKAPPQKAGETFAAPTVESATQPAEDKPEQETPSDLLDRPPEKPLDTQELQKAWKQEDKNFRTLAFSKAGLQGATVEGQVKLFQSPAVSLPPKGGRKE